ncbi:hypothetical protein MP228_005733 [Amoeboaphelidium protococcarum]|nr:hypothetical protein MP228_005733 [Amoeboaphelidium protococcarum]
MSDTDITSFCSITGASIDDAVKFLQLSDGNVESAVLLFLEGGLDVNRQELPPLDDAGNASGTARNPNITTNVNMSESDDDFDDFNQDNNTLNDNSLMDAYDPAEQQRLFDQVRQPMAAVRDTLVGGDMMMGGRGGGGVGGDLYSQMLNETGIPSRGQSNPYSIDDPFARIAQTTPGESEAGATANRLAQLFSPPHDLIYRGSFEDARAVAKSKELWLMITIHDPSEFPCQVLNRDLWKNKGVHDHVKEHFVFLQYQVHSPEAMKYQNFYKYDILPHIAIIDAVTGERMKVWTGDNIKATEFMFDLVDFMERHGGSVTTGIAGNDQIASPSSAKKIKMDQLSEDEQLALALAESAKDFNESTQSSSKQQADKGNVVDLTQEVAADQKESGTQSQHNINPIKRGDIQPGEESTNLQFKLPSGKRVVQKFAKSDKVLILFQHLKAVADELETRPFELYFHRDALSKSMDQDLQSAGIVGASLQVDFL